MTSTTGGHADFEDLRRRAIALRREGLSLRQIRDRLHIGNNDVLNRLVKGEPPPDWTRRPNAKDDLRAKARELRSQGMTYDRIQVELGCSKSSISLWVRDLPKPVPRTPSEQASLAARKRWEHEGPRREAARQATKDTARREIGTLTERELFLVGVGLYWAEGTKDKPHARRERVIFVNSDPGVIALFLAWLDLVGVERVHLRYHVMIHESAEVRAAERYWADLVEADVSTFGKTTLKRHNPKTVRKNVDTHYRGCLVIAVRRSAELYRRIEGWWYGIVGAASAADPPNRI
ncbi:hypothetical protein AB0K47_04180 [Streptomyces tirandamycinicus]|uniref:hypothetical protein n=1 Tax=Streptomyces tirandamycinicus TaxID=2174846 RepID=UPI003448FA0B